MNPVRTLQGASKQSAVTIVHITCEEGKQNDYLRSRVDKLARLGYVVFVLDMYGKGVWTTKPEADHVGINGIAYNKAADERSWNYMQHFFKEMF